MIAIFLKLSRWFTNEGVGVINLRKLYFEGEIDGKGLLDEIDRLREINKKLVSLANYRLIENARLEERAVAAEDHLAGKEI